MSLFKDADDVEQAYLKMGFHGLNGSGKTHTAALVAEGLALYIQKRTGALPGVMMGDSENGATWVKPIFKNSGIKFRIAATRSFNDLVPMIREAEKTQSILMIDSISHFWEDLKLSYAIKRKRFDNKLEIQDYGTIKPEWQKFVQTFLNSRAHIIICGRQSNEYEVEEKELDNGKIKKEWNKAGTKMKAETEMGHEPALLVEMVAERSPDRKKKLTIRKAYVQKDRSTRIDGREFKDPNFSVFMPHIESLNIGGEHTGFDPDRNSEDIFDDAGRPDWQRIRQQIEIRLDEIQSIISKHYPGRTNEEQKRKAELLETHFSTVSWKRIETFKLDELDHGYETLFIELEGKTPYGDKEIDTKNASENHSADVNNMVSEDHIEATLGKVVAQQVPHDSSSSTGNAHIGEQPVTTEPEKERPLAYFAPGAVRTREELEDQANNVIAHLVKATSMHQKQGIMSMDTELLDALNAAGLKVTKKKIEQLLA